MRERKKKLRITFSAFSPTHSFSTAFNTLDVGKAKPANVLANGYEDSVQSAVFV